MEVELCPRKVAGWIVLVRAVQTCNAAPCQWDAWDIDGCYWYLRFRHGRGTMSRDYDTDKAPIKFQDYGAPDITFEDFVAYAGVAWIPLAERIGTIFQEPPPIPR